MIEYMKRMTSLSVLSAVGDRWIAQISPWSKRDQSSETARATVRVAHEGPMNESKSCLHSTI